jgi:hypothetical protein
MPRSQNRYQAESPMTLQKLVEETHEYHAQTGGYRPSDIRRIVGDQRKGIGLSIPSGDNKHVAFDAANNNSERKKRG